jgi:LmbE family N-acetylglucosaminyl deacetylase
MTGAGLLSIPMRDRRLMVLSPHLDDAVFSCGDYLSQHPGALVVTVFAGTPGPDQAPTPWDTECGFKNPAEAMATRREEDSEALRALGAMPRQLSFLDDQYMQELAHEEREPALVASLRGLLRQERPHTVVMPLGLFHSDHVRVHRAALVCRRESEGIAWLAYEDALYRRMEGLLQERLAALLDAGVQATPLPVAMQGCSTAKEQALHCYRSQLKAFGAGGYDDCRQPERLWLVGPGGVNRGI